MGNSKSKEKKEIVYKLDNASKLAFNYKPIEFAKEDKKQVTIEGVNYEILEKVGQGGFGTVFKARNKSDVYAIKTIEVTEENKDSIIAEIQFIADIRKKFPSNESLPIVQVFGVELVDRNRLYYSMEFALGSLDDFFSYMLTLDLKSFLPLMKIVFLFVLRALLFLQSIDVTHSDIKPQNFIYLEDKNSPIEFNIKLIDFGTVKKIDVKESKLITGSIAGTMTFLAPEAFKDIVHKKSDMWSFGIMLYMLIYKDVPDYCKDVKSIGIFALNSSELIFPRCDSVFDEMLDICKKCLIKDTNKRYSALELYEIVNRNWSFCKSIIPNTYCDKTATKSLGTKYATMKSKQCFICNAYMLNSHKYRRCNDCFNKRCLDCHKFHTPGHRYRRCNDCYRKFRGS